MMIRLTVLICLTMPASFAMTAPRVRPSNPTTRPTTYRPIEWIVELDQTYSNPFDPAEIAVDATFTGPDGSRIVLPGFWNQPFRRENQSGRERIVSNGAAHWSIRFCAAKAGEWKLSVRATDRTGKTESEPLSFSVAPSDDPGFVRRAPGSSRYFQFDNGRPYFIVGPNVCWAGGLRQYEKYFSRLGAAGANYARLWMTGPSVPMETKKAGPGRYDLQACYYYDQIFESAGRNDIRCMLAIHTYGDLVTGGHFGEGNWDNNPYNAANGGPATRPAEFSTNATARELYKHRLRYLIGRYSAYTSLAFWEFFNEQDLTKGAVTPAWVAEMARYLKTNDPYRHLVTTSFAAPGPADVWTIPEIDLTQRHMYGDQGPIPNIVSAIAGNVAAHDVYKKPHLLGETGISWRGPDTQFDPKGLGTELHNTLWAAAMSGSAGGACSWWWDNYIDPKNLYSQYTGLARFAAAVDWPRRNFAPVSVPMPVFPNVRDETFTDVVLRPSLGWEKAKPAPVVVSADGSVQGQIPQFFYSPAKRELRQPLKMQMEFPRPSRLVIHIANLSQAATLAVSIDDKPAGEFALSAKPGSPDVESTKLDPRYQIYQAVINKDRILEIPAGRHTIAIDCAAGDWLSISSITLTNLISSRYTRLKCLCLSDGGDEILAWLCDPESNCTNDTAGKLPRKFEGAVLSLPIKAGSNYAIDWWDTRAGVIIEKVSASAQDGEQPTLVIPPFQRDIALRAVRISR